MKLPIHIAQAYNEIIITQKWQKNLINTFNKTKSNNIIICTIYIMGTFWQLFCWPYYFPSSLVSLKTCMLPCMTKLVIKVVI